MELLRSPRNKLIAASALLLVLVAAASLKGLDAAPIARIVLGAAAVIPFAVWVRRARKASTLSAPVRLEVLSRTGLSQRCGVALVRAEGRTFLVVHGDGYAEICDAASAPPRARRPRPPRRPSARKGGAR
jgi:flagellar protein FliO/FliZ